LAQSRVVLKEARLKRAEKGRSWDRAVNEDGTKVIIVTKPKGGKREQREAGEVSSGAEETGY